MITTSSKFHGASFRYESENGTLSANGDFRFFEGGLQNVSMNGQIVKEGITYGFWANRDEQGNVNISGVPRDLIAEVASEVATIIGEIEASDVLVEPTTNGE